MRRTHSIMAVGGSLVAAVTLAACGGSSGTTNTGSGPGTTDLKGGPVIMGTTDTVTSLDPAGAYDEGSWTLMYNMYQTPLTIPAGQNKPQGDAAKSCSYPNTKTFVCHLYPGLKFSNGDSLTSTDVKFSVERNVKINNPNGAAVLLGSLKSVDTPNPTTVVFHLSRPDTTFQYVMTTPAADIVDHKVYPADKLMTGNKVVGSGPYKLSQYKSGEQAVFTPNKYYTGPNKAQAPQFLVQYFTDTSALKLAVQNGQVNIAWRSLSPTDIKSLQSDNNVTVAFGGGSEIRYWVWDLKNPAGKSLAVRQAAAYLVNRNQIAKIAYDGTVQPLYSIVPPGFPGEVNTYQTLYGSTPNKAKAAALLRAAHIKTPVHITIGYTPSHYGPNAVDEATQIQRQLDGSGLFKVTMKSAEWTQFQTLEKQGAYDLYMLGWFPDYLDADDYLAPFLVNGGFFANGYENPQANRLVAKEQATSDQAKRIVYFKKLQMIAAKDVPFIPTWVGKNTAVYGKGIHGVNQTLDPSFIFRFWDITNTSK